MLVVGWVLVVTRACVVSGTGTELSFAEADVLVGAAEELALLGFCNEFSTGIEILALMM